MINLTILLKLEEKIKKIEDKQKYPIRAEQYTSLKSNILNEINKNPKD